MYNDLFENYIVICNIFLDDVVGEDKLANSNTKDIKIINGNVKFI